MMLDALILPRKARCPVCDRPGGTLSAPPELGGCIQYTCAAEACRWQCSAQTVSDLLRAAAVTTRVAELEAENKALTLRRERMSLILVLERRATQLHREMARATLKKLAALRPPSVTLALGLLGFSAFQLLAEELEPEEETDPRDLN